MNANLDSIDAVIYIILYYIGYFNLLHELLWCNQEASDDCAMLGTEINISTVRLIMALNHIGLILYQ